MTVSRRSVLRQGFVAALACVAGPLQAWSAKKNSSGKSSPQNKSTGADSQTLNREAFDKVVGSGFKVSSTSGDGNSVWLRLLSVQDLPELTPVDPDTMDVPPPSSAPVATTSGFVLHFMGTLPKRLPQDTYTFEHPKLGTFSLFIVPEGADGQTYFALINLLK